MRIEARELNVTLNRTAILHDVTLDVPFGRRIGLLGPNGSGKSTLLRCLAGLIAPARQQVFINHTPLAALSAGWLARRVALVTQHLTLDADLSVEEMVRLGRTPWRSAFSPWRDDDRLAVEQALSDTRLTGLRHKRWHQLSGGQQQRCAIARALAQQPDILLLDEPTNHLDIQHQLELMSLIDSLPMTTIAALHDLNLAANYCDELILLNEGVTVASGPPDAVLTPAHIRSVYGVDVSISHTPHTGYHIAWHRRPSSHPPGLRLSA